MIIRVRIFCLIRNNLFGVLGDPKTFAPTMDYCITLNGCNCKSRNYGNLTCIQDRQGGVNVQADTFLTRQPFSFIAGDLHSSAGFVTPWIRRGWHDFVEETFHRLIWGR